MMKILVKVLLCLGSLHIPCYYFNRCFPGVIVIICKMLLKRINFISFHFISQLNAALA